MVSAAFVDQAQGDIIPKLQKLEGCTGMNASQLLEVAMKIFIIWLCLRVKRGLAWCRPKNEEEGRYTCQCFSVTVHPHRSIPIGLSQGQRRSWKEGPPHPKMRLRWNQCAHCHQEGYWKNEFPSCQDCRLIPQMKEGKRLSDSRALLTTMVPDYMKLLRIILLDWLPWEMVKKIRTDLAPFC